MRTRIAVFLLALFLTAGVFPQTPEARAAAADDTAAYTSWSQLDSALANANGGVFMLTQDLTATASDGPITLRSGLTATLDLNGHTLSRNRSSAAGTGQVIVIEKNAALTIKDSSGSNAGRITGGWALYNGAGIYVYGALILEGGTVAGNRCGEKGAGIFLNGGTATVSGGVIENNTGAQFGGGIYCGEGTSLTMTGGVIRNNTASKNGGAVFLNKKAEAAISGALIDCNSAGQKGAAFYLAAESSLRLTKCEMFNNTAPGNTGYNYYLYENSFYKEDGSTISVEGLGIRKRTAYTSWLQLKNDVESGISVVLTQDITATDKDREINIQPNTDVTVDLNGFTINRNRTGSMDHGGVFRVEPNGSLTIADSSGNNGGRITGGYSINGGGVCNHGQLTVTGGTIAMNRASKNGGGVFCSKYQNGPEAVLTVTGGVIEGNTANSNGGGIFAQSSSKCTVSGGMIRNNTASWGGGLYLNAIPSAISDSGILGNTANTNCAGVFIEGGVCDIADTAIRGNTAKGNAGGIKIGTNGAVTLTDSNVSGNTAATDGGGIYVCKKAVLNVHNTPISGNASKCGAGAYLDRQGTGVFQDATFFDNTASANGGAVWMGGDSGTRAEFHHCSIRNNTAANNGGGVFAQGEGVLLLTESVLTENEASTDRGGAIDCEPKGLKLAFVNADIQNNRAGKQGGGVCAKGSVISMKGLVIIHNNTSQTTEEQNDLLLAEEAYIANPGLYEGSCVRVATTRQVIAKEISKYQVKHFIITADSHGFTVNKTVETPIIASLFGNGSFIVMAVLVVAGAAVCVSAMLIRKKKGASEGDHYDDVE